MADRYSQVILINIAFFINERSEILYTRGLSIQHYYKRYQAMLCLDRALIFDKTAYYYAIGNTCPTLLYHQKFDCPVLSSLCLAAGDPRSCLFTISKLAHSGELGTLATAEFTLNDCCPYVIARNCLLLSLILQQECDIDTVWSAWHSMYLTENQLEIIKRTLRLLISSCESTLFEKFNFKYSSESTLEKCRIIWGDWLCWDIDVNDVQTWRRDFLISKFQCKKDDLIQEFRMLSDKVCCRMGYTPVTWIGKEGKYNDANDIGMNLTWENLVYRFEEEFSGIVIGVPGNKSDTVPNNLSKVNPTLFREFGNYSLHYATAYYEGFSLFDYDTTKESILSYCQQQLSDWTNAARLNKNKLVFEFCTDDCLQVCLTTPSWLGKFNFIDTSNVSDYVNLLPLLLAIRQISIGNSTILRTTSMTHNNSISNFEVAGLVFPLLLPSNVCG